APNQRSASAAALAWHGASMSSSTWRRRQASSVTSQRMHPSGFGNFGFSAKSTGAAAAALAMARLSSRSRSVAASTSLRAMASNDSQSVVLAELAESTRKLQELRQDWQALRGGQTQAVVSRLLAREQELRDALK
ncbi:unnamed protein product, partial [Polarella glacialis]